MTVPWLSVDYQVTDPSRCESTPGNDVYGKSNLKLLARFPALVLLGIWFILYSPHALANEIKIIQIHIQRGDVSDDQRVIRVSEGDQLELVWTSDEAMEVHLHGYDIYLKLLPDIPNQMSFKAHAAGRYPIEVHGGADAHGKLLYLEVLPQ